MHMLLPIVAVVVYVGILVGLALVAQWRFARPALPAARVKRTLAPSVSTYFFPGNGAWLSQVGRYTSDIPGMKHLAAAENFVQRPYLDNSAQPFDVLPLFSHLPEGGLLHLLAMPLAQLYGALSGVYYAKPWSRAFHKLAQQGLAPAVWAPWRLNVAQEADVAHALKGLRAAMASNEPNHRWVLFGTSRGAAVAVQVFERLTPAERAKIGALVLEGVFDSSQLVLQERAPVWFWQAVVPVLLHYMCPLYSPEPEHAGAPRAAAAALVLGPETRILVVTSKADVVVRPARSRAIYDVLAAHIPESQRRLLVLERSSHSGYANEDAADRAAYAEALDWTYAHM